MSLLLRFLPLALLPLLWHIPAAEAADTSRVTVAGGIEAIANLPYTSDIDPNRMLDIYVPAKSSGTRPLVILIHGGGWNAGDKRDFAGVCLAFVHRGYAAASLNYRLSSQALFPAQAIDCKAAVRWLRARSATYGFDPKRFVVGGHSAGGHLAAFLGVTNGLKQFDQGANLNVRSDVQAVLWFAGVSDFVKRVQTPGYESESAPGSGQSLLIGGPVLQNQAKAMAASPITYVSDHAAPFDIFHGDSDRTVPVAQATEMYDALRRHHIVCELHLLPHADHGGPGYFTPTMFDQIDEFLHRVLNWHPPTERFLPGHRRYLLSPVSAPGMTLEARNAEPGGSTVGLTTESDSDRPQWQFVPADGGCFVIRPADDPTLALTVQGNGTANQTPVVVEPNTGQAAQRWMVMRDPLTDTYALLPQCAPSAGLDDFAGNATPQAAIDIFSFNEDDPHEHWVLTPAAP